MPAIAAGELMSPAHGTGDARTSAVDAFQVDHVFDARLLDDASADADSSLSHLELRRATADLGRCASCVHRVP
jgi:hypothetical protein